MWICSFAAHYSSAKEVNLIPAYAVLAIGGLNILIVSRKESEADARA